MQDFKELVEGLIGPYEVETVQMIETVISDESQITTTSQLIVPDYAWLLSALFILVTLYSIFRMIGALLSGGLFKWKV